MLAPNAESGVKLMTPPVQTRRAQNIRFWHGQAEQKSATTLPRQLDGQQTYCNIFQ